MRKLKNIFETKEWILNKFGGGILTRITDKSSTTYKTHRVGFIYSFKGIKFFMCFRRYCVGHDNGVISFECNLSELKSQINGMDIGGGRIIKNVWCMFIQPDKSINICNPVEIKMFLEKYDKHNFIFKNNNVDDEIIHLPLSLMFDFNSFIVGQTQSQFNWLAPNLFESQLKLCGTNGSS